MSESGGSGGGGTHHGLQFFRKSVDNVQCLSEKFKAFVHVDQHCINVTSYHTKATLSRISKPTPDVHFLRLDDESLLLTGLAADKQHLDSICTWNVASTTLISRIYISLNNCNISDEQKLSRRCIYFGQTEEYYEVVYLFGKIVTILKLRIPSSFDEVAGEPVEFQIVMQLPSKNAITETKSVCCEKLGNDFVITFKNIISMLFIRDKSATAHKLREDDQISKLACFHSDAASRIAVGCERGQIFLVQEVCKDSSKWVLSMHHWHALPVLTMRFSPEGGILYSGGMENVLVYWSVHAGMSTTFLPRFSGCLRTLIPLKSTDELFIAMTDDSVAIVSSAKMITSNVQLFVRDWAYTEKCQRYFKGPIRMSPSNEIVANGHPGYLQFCDPNSCLVKFELDISHMNHVSAEKANWRHPEWSIVAFDLSPLHLCTVEACKDIDKCVIIKFFATTDQGSSYDMQYSVGGTLFKKGMSVRHRPNTESEFAIQVDSVSIWSLTNTGWQLSKELKSRRKSNIVMADYSSDGSFLAVAHENYIAFWNAENNYSNFGEIEVSSSCSGIAFGRGLSSKLICISMETETVFVDVTTSLVVSTYPYQTKHVFADRLLGCFSAYVPDSQAIQVFQPKGECFEISEFKLHETNRAFALLVPRSDEAEEESKNESAPGWYARLSLVVVTHQWELLKLDHVDSRGDFSMLESSSIDYQLFNFANEHRKLTDFSRGSSVEDKIRTHKFDKYVRHEVFTQPSHLLPAPKKMFDNLIRLSLPGFLAKTPQGKLEGNDSAIEEDRLSSSEDDLPTTRREEPMEVETLPPPSTPQFSLFQSSNLTEDAHSGSLQMLENDLIIESFR